ncbi:hypothetical protein Tco_0772561 [Tanacetum coccineum]|uniref:Uncharacterized protein n=1 Tax=Tanacetum coccineum TaxID=301880 RepID=A0ABQ4ZIF4_9ASTR
MQTTEEKVDTSNALEASLVDTESSWTESKEQDISSRSGNDAHVDIRPIYDEEPMAEVQTTAEINVFATGQQHTEQLEFNNEGEVDQNAEQWHDTCPLPAKLTDNQTTKLSNQSLESENIFTTHYLPKERESAVAKPHHMIAPGSSRYSSNDMVHNHYLEEAKKKTQESGRWKLTGKIFKTVGLRWVPTGKIFTSSTPNVDGEPTNGSNDDITNQYECEQSLDVSAGTLNLSAVMTSDHNSSELGIHDHSNEPSISKLVPKVVPLADKTATSRQEFELLFSPINGGLVKKSMNFSLKKGMLRSKGEAKTTIPSGEYHTDYILANYGQNECADFGLNISGPVSYIYFVHQLRFSLKLEMEIPPGGLVCSIYDLQKKAQRSHKSKENIVPKKIKDTKSRIRHCCLVGCFVDDVGIVFLWGSFEILVVEGFVSWELGADEDGDQWLRMSVF